MNFQISPSGDEDSRKQKHIRKKFQNNSGLGLFAKTMICIVIIDGSIWGYFAFVKNVTLIEGLRGMTVFTQEALGIEQYSKKDAKVYTPKNDGITINLNSKKNITNNSNESYIYKWKEKDGTIHFSNTNCPINNKTLKITKDINPYGRQTEYKIHGGTMVIPVEIENNGRKEIIKLILDTGCGTTQIHPDVLRRLNPQKIRNGKSHIADGRTIKTEIYRIDSIKIGSIIETNFLVSTNRIEDKHGADGLLGMNFLKNHPFDIDKKKGVIIWE